MMANEGVVPGAHGHRGSDFTSGSNKAAGSKKVRAGNASRGAKSNAKGATNDAPSYANKPRAKPVYWTKALVECRGHENDLCLHGEGVGKGTACYCSAISSTPQERLNKQPHQKRRMGMGTSLPHESSWSIFDSRAVEETP